MSFVIDTDICSRYLKGDRNIFNRFVQHTGGIYLSTITLAELYSWAWRKIKAGVEIVEDLISESHVIPVEPEIAILAGQIRAELLDKGISTSTTDMLIAATALQLDYTVVTHNTSDYVNVPNIRLEDWLVA